MTLFGFSIVLIFYIPIRLIIWFQGCISWPILPLSISPTSETLSSELSIELLWLHAALPALLEQSHLRSWAKNTIRLWALSVSYALGIRSFVMGDVRTTNRVSFATQFIHCLVLILNSLYINKGKPKPKSK